MSKPGYVYILASKRNGTLYAGVTADLIRRVHEHQHDLKKGFTSRHGVHTLVYFETHDDIADAIQREKNIKKWRRTWKLELIAKENPAWNDLYPTITGFPLSRE